ncbi:MAG: hypothetical protein U0441_38125 [Polyangiaceae bacterium]
MSTKKAASKPARDAQHGGANKATTKVSHSKSAEDTKSAKAHAATKSAISKVEKLTAAAHKLSAADKAKAESLLAEIARRKDRIAEDFYELGLALRELFKKELFRALGYKSFDAMLTSRDVVSPTTARRLIQLVSSMSRDEAIAYGQEKALALLDYAKATPEIDTPKTLMETGKLPDGKPVHKASVRDLKAAAKHVRTSTGKARVDPASKEASSHAKALQTWLHSHGARGSNVTAVRSKGTYVLRVEMSLAASGKLRES